MDEFPNVEALADGRINVNTWDEYRGLKAEVKRLLSEHRKLYEENERFRKRNDTLRRATIEYYHKIGNKKLE